jgi:hypothetical protein
VSVWQTYSTSVHKFCVCLRNVQRTTYNVQRTAFTFGTLANVLGPNVGNSDQMEQTLIRPRIRSRKRAKLDFPNQKRNATSMARVSVLARGMCSSPLSSADEADAEAEAHPPYQSATEVFAFEPDAPPRKRKAASGKKGGRKAARVDAPPTVSRAL